MEIYYEDQARNIVEIMSATRVAVQKSVCGLLSQSHIRFNKC
jgi:hypothetical protein